VTDANLVLGYLDPDYFLGGELKLDEAAARRAIDMTIAAPLDITVEDAAFAIHSIASTSMASAMRVMTIQRGLDPRSFAAVALGGAGPSHIAGIAAETGISDVIVPANAGVASALGLLAAPVKFEFARTLVTPLDARAPALIESVFAELEGHAVTALAASNASVGSSRQRQVRVRYVGQGYEVPVAMFFDAYRNLYGFADPAGDLEIIDWRLTAFGPQPPAALADVAAHGAPRRDRAPSRSAYFPEVGGRVEVDVIDRSAVDPGLEIRGPAVIEERESTVLIPPGVTARVDEHRNLLLAVPVGEVAHA
jgi:N-methylhydantoinase A